MPLPLKPTMLSLLIINLKKLKELFSKYTETNKSKNYITKETSLLLNLKPLLPDKNIIKIVVINLKLNPLWCLLLMLTTPLLWWWCLLKCNNLSTVTENLNSNKDIKITETITKTTTLEEEKDKIIITENTIMIIDKIKIITNSPNNNNKLNNNNKIIMNKNNILLSSKTNKN